MLLLEAHFHKGLQLTLGVMLMLGKMIIIITVYNRVLAASHISRPLEISIKNVIFIVDFYCYARISRLHDFTFFYFVFYIQLICEYILYRIMVTRICNLIYHIIINN